MKYPFYQIDVFTDRPLGGNPLAVFPDPGEMSPEVMQAIAREMNLSETVFVSPSASGTEDYVMRIFTPRSEIPFAGHPTIGTAHLLWEIGRVDTSRNELRLKMGIGTIRVEKLAEGLFMQQPRAEFGSVRSSIQEVAEALSLDPAGLDTRYPVQTVSTGFPALIVPLNSSKQLQEISINELKLKELFEKEKMLYAFTQETVHPESIIAARGFAPSLGIPEDPATGSVAGAMGAYLARYGIVDSANYSGFQIEQGWDMGRPSRIHLKLEGTAQELLSIRVGGESVTVIQGELTL